MITRFFWSVKMLVLITYDIGITSHGGEKRLRRIAKACLDFGQRVQNSVFECAVTEEQITFLKAAILSILDKKEDSVRFYYLGNNYLRKVEQFGKQTSFDVNSELIV